MKYDYLGDWQYRDNNRNLDPLTPEFECPDVVVLITLNEQHRRIRFRKRGMTDEDHETLEASFNQRVMRELTSRCSVQVDVPLL